MFKKKDVIVTGFALFAMLFGAGNLIFPPSVGFDTGSQWGIAMFAFVLTGVGFPLVALFSSAFAGRDLDSFAVRVSPLFSKAFNVMLILAIGPLLALPRTGAVAFETSFSALKGTDSFGAYKIAFIVVFFLTALMFSLKPSKVIDRVGVILTPVLVIVLVIIIVKGAFLSPLGVPAVKDIATPFKKGFLDGYQTMDTLAAIVFSDIILKSIRKDKDLTHKQELSFLFQTGLIAAVGLGLVYAGLGFIGATLSGTGFQPQETVEILTTGVHMLLGHGGNIILGICVTGACLTTAIGLITTVADYFSGLTKVNYQAIAIVTTVVSIVFGMTGVDYIIKLSVPVLIFLYPIAIALIALNLLKNQIKNDNIFVGTVVGAGLVSGYEALGFLGVKIAALAPAYEALPLGDLGLNWLAPALVGGLVFAFIPKKNK